MDIPGAVHNVFHVDLLRPAGMDPLPSQIQDDYQPPPVQVDGQDEWKVEAILGERMTRKLGRRRRQLQYQIKWEGYARPTWEPASALQDTAALETYLGAQNSTRPRTQGEGGVRGGDVRV